MYGIFAYFGVIKKKKKLDLTYRYIKRSKALKKLHLRKYGNLIYKFKSYATRIGMTVFFLNVLFLFVILILCLMCVRIGGYFVFNKKNS